MDFEGEHDGKVAVVLGGSRGIGAAIVERLALDGAKVVFTYAASADRAEALAARLRGLVAKWSPCKPTAPTSARSRRRSTRP